MTYTPDMLEELRLLALFDLSTTQTGVKVHASAGKAAVAAAERLHERGLVTQPDGGYLTALGIDAAEHAQALLDILESAPEH